MTREEVFLKLSKEVEVLSKNGFSLIEDYSDEKLSAKVYDMVSNSKRFVFCIKCEGRFVLVNSEIHFYSSVWNNRICCELANYSDVEDKIKELIYLTVKLSK